MRQRVTPGRPREAGYNLVALIVLLVVINIAVAAAMPLWSSVVRRDQESELLFRGWQYAEAIRVFKARFGRNPVSLEEMVEVRPRCLRQLWTDPVSESGEWELLLAASGQQLVTGEGQEEARPGQGQVVAGGRAPGGRLRQPARPTPDPRPRRGLPGASDQELGPIDGVRPSATGPSLKSFLGRTDYSQWEFRASMITGPRLTPSGVPQSPSLDPESMSRPLPGAPTAAPDAAPTPRTPGEGGLGG